MKDHALFIMTEFYQLKMHQGKPVDLYYNVSLTTDLDTGEQTETKDLLEIKRAIVSCLDSKYKLSASIHSKFEHEDTIVLIDYHDLPQRYKYNTEDYFVIEGKKYKIISFEQIGAQGYIFVVRNTQKERPAQVKTINIRHQVNMITEVPVSD